MKLSKVKMMIGDYSVQNCLWGVVLFRQKLEVEKHLVKILISGIKMPTLKHGTFAPCSGELVLQFAWVMLIWWRHQQVATLLFWTAGPAISYSSLTFIATYGLAPLRREVIRGPIFEKFRRNFHWSGHMKKEFYAISCSGTREKFFISNEVLWSQSTKLAPLRYQV